MPRYEAELLAFIEAADIEEARVLADQAAKQVELRLGAGPHSVAAWVPGITDSYVAEAELVLVKEAE